MMFACGRVRRGGSWRVASHRGFLQRWERSFQSAAMSRVVPPTVDLVHWLGLWGGTGRSFPPDGLFVFGQVRPPARPMGVVASEAGGIRAYGVVEGRKKMPVQDCQHWQRAAPNPRSVNSPNTLHGLDRTDIFAMHLPSRCHHSVPAFLKCLQLQPSIHAEAEEGTRAGPKRLSSPHWPCQTSGSNQLGPSWPILCAFIPTAARNTGPLSSGISRPRSRNQAPSNPHHSPGPGASPSHPHFLRTCRTFEVLGT